MGERREDFWLEGSMKTTENRDNVLGNVTAFPWAEMREGHSMGADQHVDRFSPRKQ